MRNWRKSIYAGMLVGLGVLVNTTAENHYIGAMLFSLALLTIINSSLTLFTGKIGYFNEYGLLEFVSMLFFNLVGIICISSIGMIASNNVATAITTTQKFEKPIYVLFILAFLCGVCMYVAVSNKNHIITVFAIMIFILSGFEHCIADFPYFIGSLSFDFRADMILIAKYVAIIAGNSLGAILTHYLNTDFGEVK